jgi:hypothetical protein
MCAVSVVITANGGVSINSTQWACFYLAFFTKVTMYEVALNNSSVAFILEIWKHMKVGLTYNGVMSIKRFTYKQNKNAL